MFEIRNVLIPAAFMLKDKKNQRTYYSMLSKPFLSKERFFLFFGRLEMLLFFFAEYKGGVNMRISHMFQRNRPVISFEVFPPKKDAQVSTIYHTIEELADLKPAFISVTYGAGGTGGDHTIEIASLIKNQYGIEALPHITCIGASRKNMLDNLKKLQDNKIENILALRGDIPTNTEQHTITLYPHAVDLIKEIKAFGDFSIGAATYPEGHIECDELEKDLQHLQLKVAAGADFLISQLFFENDIFYNYLERIRSHGIQTKVSAGIMPILSKKQIEKMIFMCGASLPAKVIKLLARYENNPESLRKQGIEYATRQVEDLIASGVDGIHLYTMNQPDIAKEILAQGIYGKVI